ncbi:MAG: DUF4998 domain-containing protein, partial [Bacteroidales bacterium]|nr:DUF4998 domain-containing protein [Bacteroidales bacterium]
MKGIKYFSTLIIIMSMFASCDDMMDVHKEYIEGGEIVYAPNLDSLCFYAGHNKVYFKFWTFNAVNVGSIDLYWDEDSLIIPVTPSSGLDSIMVEVPCTEEKSYTFTVRTTDVFGNHSLWNTGFANSYGDFFQQSLSNRSVKGFELVGSDGQISWFPSASNLVRSEVRYTDTNQQEQIVKVPADQLVTQCPGLTSNRFEVQSFFLPETNAVDTFVVTWEQVNPLYKYSRAGWSVKYCNSWQGMPSLTTANEMPPCIFDNNFATFWHSRYTTLTAGYNPAYPDITRDPPPFTIVIDMGEPMEIIQVDLYRRLNNNNTQTVIVYAPTVEDNLLTQEDIEWLGNTPVSYTNHTFFKNYYYAGVENSN